MKLYALLLLLFASRIILATTYYVAPNGNDSNPGTFSEPWKTWGKAFNAIEVQPGDTVYFRGGVYIKDLEEGDDNWYYPRRSLNGTGYAISRNGTAGNILCYFGYPGETPILDCSNVDPDPVNWANYGIRGGLNYAHFKGLTIRNVRQIHTPQTDPIKYDAAIGWTTGGTELIIENCTFHGVDGIGLQITGGSPLTVINCDFYDCYDELSPTPGNRGTGCAVLNTTTLTSEVYIKYCRAWDCGDQGFTCNDRGYTEYDGCWSFTNGRIGGAGGLGFKFGLNNYDDPDLQRTYKNCIAAFNRADGFSTNDKDHYVHGMNVFNNTSYHNGYFADYTAAVGFRIAYTVESEEEELRRVFKNNIAYDNYYADFYAIGGSSASYTHSNNTWDIPLTITDADFESVDSTGITAARQADGSLPDNNCYKYFLHLSSTSQARGAGISVGLIYDADSVLWDDPPSIGAFEANPGSVAPVSPVYNSSVIEDAAPSKLEITYNLTLANIVPSGSAFTVMVNSSARSVSSVSISGARVMLTLSSPVVYGDVVTVAYTKPSTNPLQTDSGELASSIVAQAVTNNCTLPANQPPVIYISSPAKSSSFTSPATIIFDVNASDPDGSIAKVEFFNGSYKLAEITTNPYSYTWKEVPAGTYSISAVATDNRNGKTVSETIAVTVNNITTTINQLPVIRITSPDNNSSIEAPSTVILTANASDPDGNIIKVEYFTDKEKIGESYEAPYAIQFECLKVGTYEITAIATDNLNAVALSSAVLFNTILKNNPDIIGLYPNPNDGVFTISLLNSFLADENILIITTLKGKTVYNSILYKKENIMQFDLSYLDSGIYVLMIYSDHIIYTKKFIKT